MKAAAVALLWCAGQAAAQGTGVVYGTVRDTTGRPVPSARVLIVGQPLPAVADALGVYRLAGVPAGAVVVRAGSIGYDPARHEIDLRAGDSVEVDLVLTPHGIERTRDYFDLPGVIVTAAKRSQLIEDAVTSVAVVSEHDLAARAVNTVDEAIDRAAGVQLLNGQINIRGSTGYVLGIGARVLLLVDGVPMNQGDRGGINWDIIPVDQVQRVEIVKGAGSALYGSAAFGGVVNLITREIPTGFHARVRTTAGAYANPPHPEWRFRDETGLQGGGDVTASYGRGPFRGSVAAGARRSDGYREQDERDHWQLAGRGVWAFADATELRVSGTWALDDYDAPLVWCTGFCDDQGQAYQPFKVDTMDGRSHTASYKGFLTATLARQASDRLLWQARASWLRTRFNGRRRSATEFSVANRLGAEARGEFRRGEGGVVTVGAELTRADVESDFLGTHAQGEYAAYGLSEQPLGRLRTTTGLRVDFLTVDGGSLRAFLSPRVGAVLPTRAGAWRASAGRGFRAPSIAERFPHITGGGFDVIENPLLDPETSWSFELGHARSLASRLRLDAAAFWTEAAGLIEPVRVDDPTGVPKIQFRNLSRARLVGLDLTTAVSLLPRVVASLAYQLLYARELAHDSEAERPLASRPTHLATLSLAYDVRRFATLGADLRHTSRFDRVELYDGDERVAATVLDLRARYSRGPLAVNLLVANALNYIYNLVPRTLAPVRTITATASWAY